MSEKQEGRCLCGGVQYTVDPSAVVGAGHCHCKDCQRCTGSGFATFLFVPEAALDVASGDVGSFEVTGESGGAVVRSFCKNCGSQLWSRVAVMPGLFFLKAGTLDDASWVKPQAAYWGASANPWAPPVPGVPLHERNPG